eukprot:213710-Pleurochrysis_carterae.AAC.1
MKSARRARLSRGSVSVTRADGGLQVSRCFKWRRKDRGGVEGRDNGPRSWRSKQMTHGSTTQSGHAHCSANTIGRPR